MSLPWKDECKRLYAALAEEKQKAKRFRCTAEAGLFLACTLLSFRTDHYNPNLLHVGRAEMEALAMFCESYGNNVDKAKIFTLYGKLDWMDHPGPWHGRKFECTSVKSKEEPCKSPTYQAISLRW